MTKPSDLLAMHMGIKQWASLGHIRYKIHGHGLFIDGTDDWQDIIAFGDGYEFDAKVLRQHVKHNHITFIVGYSAGAAMGERIAADLSIQCWSFAAPRYLCKGEEQAGEQCSIIRVSNRGDYVPLIPFWRSRHREVRSIKTGSWLSLLIPSIKNHGKQRLLNRLKKIDQ